MQSFLSCESDGARKCHYKTLAIIHTWRLPFRNAWWCFNAGCIPQRMIIAVTDLLKGLLHEYGILTVSLSKLEGERPAKPHESLNAYYESMGTPYEGPASVMREKIAALDPDEPK